MSGEAPDGPAEPAVPGRLLDRIEGRPGGPTVILTAAIHGNEPAGLTAALRVFARLRKEQRTIAGRLAALIGNLGALRSGLRFLDEDLNRRWTPERVAALREGTSVGSFVAEDREQLELLDEFDELLEGSTGPYVFLDLHTSSAEGPPFLTVGDTLPNRRFARGFPLPLILGLEEQVDGALLEYLNNRGFVTVGIEAGQHQSDASVERIEAVLWLALARAGAILQRDIPGEARLRALLRAASQGIPPVIEVRRRHAIHEEDGFRMRPGFRNFQRVRAGQLLAPDRRGAVTAAESGCVLLPLYQGKGNDGFFLARRVPPLWLAVSSLLRRARVAALLPLLPGVRREPGRPELLRVDTRIARWCTLGLCHLFGYRKLRRSGNLLLVARRRHDFHSPRVLRSI
jgi:succinylglutamate desuccinylase